MVLKGDARFGLYDLEGEGGLGHDSITDTTTLGTRSAFLALDRARLAVRLLTPSPVAFYSALRFEATQSRVEGAFIDVTHAFGGGWADGWGVHGELGLNAPMAAADRLMFRKSLAERIYWDEPEMHLAVTGSRVFGGAAVWLGASAAMMRPLGLVPVNDASSRGGTLAVLASRQNRPFSGNEPVLGAQAGVRVAGVSVEGFGHVGGLAREAGIDEIANNIPYYTGRERRAAIGEDSTFWWVGGRVDGLWQGVEVRVEGIASRESALSRWTAYAQAGVGIDGFGDFFGRFTPRVRWETYRIVDGGRLRAASPSNALTWDWDVATAGVEVLVYRDVIRLFVEYSFIGEIREGDGGAPWVGLVNDVYANDELTAQFELRF